MLVSVFPSAVFGTNCYVLATGPGTECVVVDPGIEVLGWLGSTLATERLKPVAVLLTHGHLDHTYSVTPVCTGHDVPALLHADDAHRLQDPLAELGPGLLPMLEQQFGRAATWTPPSDVRTVVDGETVELAGLPFTVAHAPGHTEGSVLFGLPDVPDGPQGEGLSSSVLAGDVLFAGSIGRTDLPGGDHAAMLRTLRDVVLPLDDDALVLPGHGAATTVARERATNPYLRQAAS